MGTASKPPPTPATASPPGVPYRVDRCTGIRWHPRRGHIWRPRTGAVVCFYRTLKPREGAFAQCDRCGRMLNDLRTLATEDGAPLSTMPPALLRWIQARRKGDAPFPKVSAGKMAELFDEFGPPDP